MLEMSKTMISGLVEKLNSIIREIRVKSFINDYLTVDATNRYAYNNTLIGKI